MTEVANLIEVASTPAGTLIDGEWSDAGSTFPVLDKYTGDVVAQCPETPVGLVDDAVASLVRGSETAVLTPLERAAVLRRTAVLINERRGQFRELIVAEAGFTLNDVEGEIDRSLITLELCAEEATRLVGDTAVFAAPGQESRLGFTIRVPLGVICAISPFNSPLNLVIHKVGPALAAGNAVIVKPSGFTPLSAALLCQTLLDAGLPPSLLALVNGTGAEVGQALLAQSDIAFYTFTGSTAVGREVQRGAGLRRTQLELGSIASTIVCADGNLDKAIPLIANAGFRKAGQVCTSIQRLYVEEPVFDEVTERLVAAAEGLRAGDPRDPEVKIGPLISEAAAERVEEWVAEASAAGARVLAGGRRDRSVYQPTVLHGAREGMKVMDCEIFGPVLSVLPFRDLDEAIAGANGTEFGLSVGFFSQDIDRALRAATSLRFGSVHLNQASSYRADSMPFGGVKSSGIGHEGPFYAVRNMSEERLVTFNP
jgi:succinate-semialdehyde dehydrogenase / glutarate-semialdehyde dehydrogenase